MRTVDNAIRFMGYRKMLGLFSLVLIVLSVVSLSTKGLQFGLDFTGGTLIEIGYEEPANLQAIRDQLTGAGFESFNVVYFGSDNDVLVRLQQGFEEGLGEEVLATLRQDESTQLTLRRIEFVGPQVGEQLREDGGLGMLVALIVVMIYIALRFQYKFALGAVLALAHDVILTLGLFSVLELEFDLTVLAAVLAVIGYSLNDTIVVFDRIRENFRVLRKRESHEVINFSLTQTLVRTLVTSLTTLLVLIALFYFGGELIHNFATALIFGVVIGTYSSIYVASNLLLQLRLTREDLLPPKEEEDSPEEVAP